MSDLRSRISSKDKSWWIIGITVLIFLMDLGLQMYFRDRGEGIANGGISFGLFQGLSLPLNIIFYLIFVIWVLAVLKGKMTLWLIAIMVGGLGNLVPRTVWGYVWDYLYFYPLPFWFNLSDFLITTGVVVFLGEGIVSVFEATSYTKD